MADFSADTDRLRELAAKCRRFAETLTDQTDVASFRRMAAEYDAMARRKHPAVPDQHAPGQ